MQTASMTFAKIDFAKFDGAKYFPSLDGMRAFCVLLVMFNHVHAEVPHWVLGWLGVDVFFVLSGFLITTLMVRERERSGRVSLKAFYTRRFFRIIPIYLFTVLIYAIAVRVTHDAVKTAEFNKAIPWLLSFMQEYRPAGSGNVLGHSWTLGIEEKFYVFWPLLLIILYPFRTRRIWLLAAVFLAVLSLPHVYARSYGGLLVGAALAIALSSRGRWTSLEPLLALPDVYPCLMVLGTYALCCFDYRWVLLFSAAVAWLIASLVLRPGRVRSLLESRILVYIGKRSYAIYLIHVLVLDSVSRLSATVVPANAVLVVMISYVGCIGCAALMHTLIEQPCIGWGKRMSANMVATA
jgi:peptidoglycan/LPS O-acetylase OafA/YrhL